MLHKQLIYLTLPQGFNLFKYNLVLKFEQSKNELLTLIVLFGICPSFLLTPKSKAIQIRWFTPGNSDGTKLF